MFPLNPILLYLGVAGITVPIVIHLLNRRKFQKVVWAAMRFLRVSVEQNQRRMRIEDLVLLALRCLLVLLIGLALSRPVLGRLSKTLFGSQATAVLILDNSYSMGMNDGTQTRFDKARTAAQQVLETMSAGSSAAVLLASDIPRAVIPEPTFDLNLARRVIREAVLSDRSTDLAPSLDRALEILRSRLLLRGEIYVFTDGQSSGWRHLSRIAQALDRNRDKIRAHVVLVGEHDDHNLGLSELRLASGLAPVRHPLRFEARVTNYGGQDARDVRVALNIDSDAPSDEFTIDLLPAGASRSVSLFARLRADGFHSATARIDGDRLPADDKRTIVLRGLKEVRILLVDGQPAATARETATFYLRHALVPVPPEETASYFIKASKTAPSDLASARFEDFDAVLLANVADFPEAAAQGLANFVRRGGGLAIFPGDRLKPAFFNAVLGQKLGLLPASFGQPLGQANQDEKFLSLDDKNLDHPLVSLWNDPASGTLSSARFYRAWELIPASLTNFPAVSGRPPSEKGTNLDTSDAHVVIRFADGKPALMQRDFGLGRVLLFSSSVDTSWNDLPVRPAFVPLMHRLLGALIERQDEGLNIRVGSRFSRRVPSDWLGRDAVVLRPKITESIPRDTRRIEMAEGWPVIQYDQTDSSGVYEVGLGENSPPSLQFAAQSEPAESFLDELSAEQKKLLAGAAHVVEWGPRVSMKERIENERRGAEFWVPLLLAALIAALLEIALGQWFSRSK